MERKSPSSKYDIIEFAFSPGEGSAAASLFVDGGQGARDTSWLSTMVLSAGRILGALTDVLASGGKRKGIFDETQSALQKIFLSKVPPEKAIAELSTALNKMIYKKK